MEYSLKEVVSIVQSIQTLDWYSVWFWLSLALPVFIALIIRLLPKSEEDKPLNIKHLPLMFILFFTVSVIIALWGQREKDNVRNLGWELKNHMVHNGYYAMLVTEIEQSNPKLDANAVKSIVKSFPKEFSLAYSASGNIADKSKGNKGASNGALTVIIADSVTKDYIMRRSVKILDAYLTNDKVLVAGNVKPFLELYSQNNLFTNSVIYKLIADSSQRYSMNLNQQGQLGIVRRSYNPDKVKLLYAYLTNDAVLEKGYKKDYTDIQKASEYFTEDVINEMVTKYPTEFQINLADINAPSKDLTVFRKQ
ncbi:MAG: hypothetical protein SFW35_01800 [Chitinophagales bacterium]|nr:hypothetical protein [Chitinophagales bacterium]